MLWFARHWTTSTRQAATSVLACSAPLLEKSWTQENRRPRSRPRLEPHVPKYRKPKKGTAVQLLRGQESCSWGFPCSKVCRFVQRVLLQSNLPSYIDGSTIPIKCSTFWNFQLFECSSPMTWASVKGNESSAVPPRHFACHPQDLSVPKRLQTSNQLLLWPDGYFILWSEKWKDVLILNIDFSNDEFKSGPYFLLLSSTLFFEVMSASICSVIEPAWDCWTETSLKFVLKRCKNVILLGRRFVHLSVP
jgi:hypothetical protein